MTKLLITGGDGQLGQSLQIISENYPSFEILPTDLKTMDITDTKSVSRLITDFCPDFIINCAAYTAVDDAETDAETAFKINSYGPEVLALNCAEHEIPLIHISTDYVFSGDADRPYTESDPPGPVTVYGKSKLEGEVKIQESGVNNIIIRTSWLYSEFGSNFLKTMIRLGQDMDQIKVVSDQLGSPTYSGALASGIMHMISFYPDDIKNGTKKDIYHFCNKGQCTWFDFALEIMRIYGLECKVHPVGTEEFPRPAPRPAFSVLNADLFSEDFNFEIPDWKTSLESCIRKLKKQ